MTFTESERICEEEFEKAGEFWHLYTDGNLMGNIFCNDEDFNTAMTALAITAILHKKIRIITFELMNNHIHLILNGERDACLELFEKFKIRIRKLLLNNGNHINWEQFKATILKIYNLSSLRNEIIYVNRNAFVTNPRFTPFSYPWGGGCAYFSPIINSLPAKSLKEIGFNRGRKLTHFREIKMIEDIKFVEDTAYIPSFCRTDIGERMFRDARSYFYALTRNAEAFSEIAGRLKDTIFLTDDELFIVSVKFAESKYGCRQLTLLNPEQKIQLAKELHFKYNASNQQIRRLLRLDIRILSELFPSQSGEGRP